MPAPAALQGHDPPKCLPFRRVPWSRNRPQSPPPEPQLTPPPPPIPKPPRHHHDVLFHHHAYLTIVAALMNHVLLLSISVVTNPARLTIAALHCCQNVDIYMLRLQRISD
ncbi:hypothetical protein PTKIN_Ptkin08bG0167100 [Pterospermum kingtungense]